MPTTQKSKSTQSKTKKKGSRSSSLKDIADERGGKPSGVKSRKPRKSSSAPKATSKKESSVHKKPSAKRKQRNPFQSPPKFPVGTKTVDGKIYEMVMELTVTLISQQMVPRYPKVTTMETVLEGKQIFKAGTVRMTLLEGSHIQQEVVKGVDAEDVELILKLFGLAEDDDKDKSSKAKKSKG